MKAEANKAHTSEADAGQSTNPFANDPDEAAHEESAPEAPEDSKDSDETSDNSIE